MALRRHAAVLGRLRLLHHRHAQFGLYRSDSQRAVGASAGKHDADGAFPLVLGQRTKEIVDRQPRRFLAVGFQRCSVPPRSPDVRPTGRRRRGWARARPVGRLDHRHLRFFAEQLGQQAGVARMLMRHHDERHSRLGRHALERTSKASRPPAEAPMPTIGKAAWPSVTGSGAAASAA